MAFSLPGDITWAETEYGMVLLDEVRGRYWNLNPTGVTVLRTLLEKGDVNDAAEALVRDYAVDRATAGHDAGELLAVLCSAGLLRETGR